jgi:hypothetical protein
VAKNPVLLNALQKLEGKVFVPSAIVSMVPTIGNLRALVSTYVNELHRLVREKFLGNIQLKYDKRELFKLSDGGQIYLDFMGSRFFNNGTNDSRPLLFIIPGLTNDSQ